MTRRTVLATLSVVVGVALLAACGGAVWSERADDGRQRDCAAELAADEARVRTDRTWTTKDVPGVGDYLEIHWQVDHPSFACSRAPGPNDRVYQGVVRLAPADARALAAGYDWVAPTADPPPTVWPGLTAYVPDGVSWRHSPGYDQVAHATVVFDPDRALLLFTVAD